MRFHIVTDSSVQFAHPQLAAQYPLTIVPNTTVVGGKRYRNGVDVTPEKLLDAINTHPTPPQTIAPSVDEFVAAYTKLAHHTDVILSLHPSRALSDSYAHAQAAAQQLDGHADVHVIDSRTTDVALGMVIRATVRAIESYNDPEIIVSRVRGSVDHIYAAFYTESTQFLVANKLLAPSHAVLGAMTGTMPILSVEDGEVAIIEKVRNRTQAVDRLVEFAIEFDDIEDALIVQSGTFMSEQSRALQDRLSVEFPQLHFPHAPYGTALAAIIGPNATGIALMERDLNADDEDDA